MDAFRILVVCLMIIISVSCTPSQTTTYVIEITGTPGTLFTGSIGAAGQQRTVDGVIPMNFTVRGWPAVAVIQKDYDNDDPRAIDLWERGALIVTIKENGRIVASEGTNAKAGSVGVSSP